MTVQQYPGHALYGGAQEKSETGLKFCVSGADTFIGSGKYFQIVKYIR